VPYVVTAAVVAAILHRYSAREIGSQMAAGHWLRMLPFGLLMPFVVWLPYAAYDRIVFQGALGPVALREVIRAKAAVSVLLTVGYVVGGGGYAVWIARTTRVGAARAAGVVLYVMASDLMAVCAVAGTSMWIHPLVATSLRSIATGLFAVQAALIVMGPYGSRLPRFFDAWRTVPRAASLVQIIGRTGNIAIITGFTWGAMRAFGIDIPASIAAMYIPMIVLIVSLPINVAGLGAAQAAWLLLLPWATGPQLLAFQALWNVFVAAGILVRGLPFVRAVTREIEDGKADSVARA
jgi:hypothetical protein